MAPHDPAWAARAAALRYEPIVTVYAQQRRHAPARADARSSPPTTAVRPSSSSTAASSAAPPACSPSSSAAPRPGWRRGLAATETATLAQARAELAPHLAGPLEALRTIVEKRATFRCTPRLDRPPAAVAPGLAVAGDYVDGPYPATLEGAVRSGTAAARSLLSPRGS